MAFFLKPTLNLEEPVSRGLGRIERAILAAVLAEVRIMFADVAAGPATRYAEASDLDHAVVPADLIIKLLLPEMV